LLRGRSGERRDIHFWRRHTLLDEGTLLGDRRGGGGVMLIFIGKCYCEVEEEEQHTCMYGTTLLRGKSGEGANRQLLMRQWCWAILEKEEETHTYS